MGELVNNALIAKPRIVLEQQEDGSLIIESYLNGSRTRVAVPRGFELQTIREELAIQAKALKSAKDRYQTAQEAAERRRHNSNWRYVAENYGKGFANRTINGVISLKTNARTNSGLDEQGRHILGENFVNPEDVL